MKNLASTVSVALCPLVENFSGSRHLAYGVMCNHFHLLLEVTPRSQVALTDEQFHYPLTFQ